MAIKKVKAVKKVKTQQQLRKQLSKGMKPFVSELEMQGIPVTFYETDEELEEAVRATGKPVVDGVTGRPVIDNAKIRAAMAKIRK